MAAATSTHATNVHLIKNLSYDPVKNFTPIVTSVETIGCLVVNTTVVPVNSVTELVDYAKENPGKLSFGSSGAGSFFHLAGELFNQVAGVKMTHVPYRGSVAAFTDLIGGHIQVNFTQLSQAMAYRDNDKLKVLAVLETVRFSAHPEFPSITDELPGFRMPPTWNGIVGPAGLAGAGGGAAQRRVQQGARTFPRSKASSRTTAIASSAARPRRSASVSAATSRSTGRSSSRWACRRSKKRRGVPGSAGAHDRTAQPRRHRGPRHRQGIRGLSHRRSAPPSRPSCRSRRMA